MISLANLYNFLACKFEKRASNFRSVRTNASQRKRLALNNVDDRHNNIICKYKTMQWRKKGRNEPQRGSTRRSRRGRSVYGIDPWTIVDEIRRYTSRSSGFAWLMAGCCSLPLSFTTSERVSGVPLVLCTLRQRTALSLSLAGSLFVP